MTRVSPLFEVTSRRAPKIQPGFVSNMRIADSGPHYDGTSPFIADLSAIRKRLVIGNAANDWITQHTGVCPTTMFALQPLGDSAYAVRIHRSQYVVVDGPASDRFDELFLLPHGRHGQVLVLDYECAEVALGGNGAESIVSELCPLPVAELAANTWCATRLAHADIVISVVDHPNRHYRIMISPADARFVYAIMSDAVVENNGQQIGFENYWQEFQRGDPGQYPG